jgi:flagellar biosynthesis/type III secretory pathway M-ring protein FliF/YscJ
VTTEVPETTAAPSSEAPTTVSISPTEQQGISSSASSSSTILIVIIVVVVAVLAILAAILVVYLVKRRKRVMDEDVDAVGLTDVKAVAEQQPSATTKS